MNAVVYLTLGAFGVSAIVLWIYCFRDLAQSAVFSSGSKTMWFVVILLAPVGGPIAYLTAKKNIERFSRRDHGRIARLTSNEKEEKA
jgi:hypothetical protein